MSEHFHCLCRTGRALFGHPSALLVGCLPGPAVSSRRASRDVLRAIPMAHWGQCERGA